MMRYAAIDIETSGLDPDRHQVLELACVVDADWSTPVEALPTFRALVSSGDVMGDPRALVMNADLLRELADAPRTTLDGCLIDLSGFLDEHFPDRHEKGRGVTVAGKNFGAFDLQFLKRSGLWQAVRAHHRFIDAGNLWWNPAEDACLPNLAECVARAGLKSRKGHSAVEDCRSVVELVRAKYAGWTP